MSIDAEFVAVGRRKFAEAEIRRFLAAHKTNVDWTVLQNDFVCHALGRLDLIFGQRRRLEIDRTIIVGHVERDGWQIEEPDKCGREDVLSGMLLHVVTPTGGVDHASDAGSRAHGLQRGFEVVDDAAVFGIGDFGDADAYLRRW